MAEPLLAAAHLSKTFRTSRGLFRTAAKVYAVDDVSLYVNAGETLSIVGESGCGKSTLLRLLSRLIDPDKGTLRFAGRDLMGLDRSDLRRQRDAMQMVFQDPFASLDPRMRIGAILDEPLRLHGRGNASQRRARVGELLALVGLAAAHAGRFPHEFSGGQRQRIGIARALALNPQLILADEPVSALDVSVQAQIINLLQDLQDRFGLSYVIVAHDLTVVRHMSDRVAVMYLGRVVETAATSQIFATPRHPYTHGLLAAIPVPRPGLRRSAVLLQGDAPSPTAPPSGCHFHTRCAYAQARCAVDVPSLEATPDGHAVACHFWREIAPPQDLAARVVLTRAPAYQARLDAAARRRSMRADAVMRAS